MQLLKHITLVKGATYLEFITYIYISELLKKTLLALSIVY